MTSVTLVLSADVAEESTLTALLLAERLLARGSRVTVYARDTAATLSAGHDEVAAAVGALLRRGLHGGTLDWVVDSAAAERLGATDHAPGVIPGGPEDLWAFIRDADAVLAQPGSRA